MNPQAEILSEAVRSHRRENRIRNRRPKPQPMDEITRDTLIAEVMGTEPPPMIIPVLKKHRHR